MQSKAALINEIIVYVFLRLHRQKISKGKNATLERSHSHVKVERVLCQSVLGTEARTSLSCSWESFIFFCRDCYWHCNQHRGSHCHRADCISRIESRKWENPHCYWDRTFRLPGGRSGHFHRRALLHYICFYAVQDSGLHHLPNWHHCGKCARGTASHSNGKPTLKFTGGHCSSSGTTTIHHFWVHYAPTLISEEQSIY